MTVYPELSYLRVTLMDACDAMDEVRHALDDAVGMEVGKETIATVNGMRDLADDLCSRLDNLILQLRS